MSVDQFLQHFGITPERVRPVAVQDCEIYRITPQAGERPAGDLALRIYPHDKHDLAAIEAEVDWLRALGDAGVHVPRPVADRDGRFVKRWQPHGDVEPRHAVLLTWLGGRLHHKGLSPARLARVGELTARLHSSAQALARDGCFRTERLAFSVDLGAWADDRRPASAHVSPPLLPLATQAAARLRAEIGMFARDESAYGFVHGDLHPWNLIFTGQVAGAFDFSECGWGHHALDLATSLQYLKHPLAGLHDHRAQYTRLHDALLAGYVRVRPLPAGVERQVEIYIVARMLATLEWIIDDWPQPDHRAWGPAFLSGCEAIFADYLDG